MCRLNRIIWLLTLVGLMFSCDNQSKKPNVLFISIDDLRPELGCYGNEVAITPQLDKLAAEGSVFINHYVQVPTCGASRHCLLTGMRPRTTAQLRNQVIEKELAEKPESAVPETFIHQLKRNGYYTVGIGKISHSPDGLVYGYEEELSNKRELPHSWDELEFNHGRWGTGWNAFFGYASGENRQSLNKNVKPYEKGEVEDDGYVDGLTAQLAITKLGELKERNGPFFLGIGFFKPHLPFNAPGKYWDLYDRDEIPLSPNPHIPENINTKSLHNSGEFNQYKLTDEQAGLSHSVSDDYARKLRHAYLASVSYIDAQVGKVLEELRRLELEENTIVIIWGDHGWHLGDQRVWGKHTLFESALKSVMIVKVPGKKTVNNMIRSVVETVDIYPSILELCNVELPYNTDGESFVDLLESPTIHKADVAYSYYNNGISLRTDRYRMTRYFREDEPIVELYDLENDPYEKENIALLKPEITKELTTVLERGNTGLFELATGENIK